MSLPQIISFFIDSLDDEELKYMLFTKADTLFNVKTPKSIELCPKYNIDQENIKSFLDSNYIITHNIYDRVNRPKLYEKYIEFCLLNHVKILGKKIVYRNIIKMSDHKISVYRDRDFTFMKEKS